MDFSVGPVKRAFNSYKSQERFAELVKKNPVKTRQGQQERVTLSEEARTLLKLSQLNEQSARTTSLSAAQAESPVPEPEEVEESTPRGLPVVGGGK